MKQASPAAEDRVVSRQAMDADVQEAADDAPQYEDRQQREPDWQTSGYHDQVSPEPTSALTASTPTAATSSIVRPVVSIVNVWQLR